MRVRKIALVIFLCLTSSLLLGQASVSTGSETPASAEDIRKMLDVMHMRDQMKLIMQQVSQQMRSMEHEQVKKRDSKATDEDLAKLDAISDEVMKNFSMDGLLDDMIPVYQKYLTKEDVDAMIGFYSTPTGQKILKQMPAMTAEGMRAMQPRLRKMVDDATAQVEKLMQEQEKKPADAAPNTVKN